MISARGRPPPGSPDLPPIGREISGLEEMCAIRWSPPITLAALAVVEQGVARRVAGAVQHLQRAVGERELRAVGERVVTFVEPPQARNERDTERSAVTTSRGMPWRSISASASSSSRSASDAKSSITGASRSSAQTSAFERRARMSTSPRWSMCWWVMTIRSRSSIRCP